MIKRAVVGFVVRFTDLNSAVIMSYCCKRGHYLLTSKGEGPGRYHILYLPNSAVVSSPHSSYPVKLLINTTKELPSKLRAVAFTGTTQINATKSTQGESENFVTFCAIGLYAIQKDGWVPQNCFP